MKKIVKMFQLRLNKSEMRIAKKIMAIIMVPMFVIQMSSINLLTMGMMYAGADDEPSISADSEGSVSEDETDSDSDEGETTVDDEKDSASEETVVAEEPVAENVQAPTEQPSEDEIINEEEESDEVTTEEETSTEEASDEKPEWQVSDDGKTAEIGPVEKGVTYKAPQDKDVTVTFTKLPDNPGNLKIEEITLTDEEMVSLGALSNKAYDITSSMENGTFKYDLTLPKPENVDVQIAYTEKSADELEKIEPEDLKVIDEDKIDVNEDTIEANGIDHFTIFYMAPVNTGSVSASVSPSSLTAKIGDTLTITLSSTLNTLVVGACTVNSKNVAGTFAGPSGSGPYTYTLTYVVASGDADWTAGNLPINCSLTDGATNSATVIDFNDSNSLAGDANAPTFANVALGSDEYVNSTEATSGVNIGIITTGVEDGRTVSCTITDTVAGSVGPVTGTTSSNIATIATGALTSLADGLLTATCSVSDAAGNPAVNGTDTSTKDVAVPTTPSSIHIASNNATTTLAKSGDTVTVTATVDAATTVSGTIDGKATTTNTVVGTTATLTRVLDASETEGAGLDFTLVSTDAAGNNATTVTKAGIIDGSAVQTDFTNPTCPAPTIAEGTNPNEQYAVGNVIYYTTNISGTGDFTVSEAATDSGSGIQKVNFPATGDISGGGDVANPGPYSSLYTWSALDSYDNNSTITCYDAAGNTATSTLTIHRDNTNPSGFSVALNDNIVKDGASITVTTTLTETGSGIASCHAYWSTDTAADGGDVDLGDLGTDCSGSVTVPNPSAGEGTYYIVVSDGSAPALGVGDNVGLFQTTGTSSSAITVDNSSPTVDAGTDVSANAATVFPVALNATVNASIAGVASYTWSQTAGPGTVTFSNTAIEDPNVTVVSVDGVYTLQLSVLDNSGNSASDTLTFTYDTGAPTGTVDLSAATINVANRTQTVTVTYDEPMAATAPTITFSSGTFVSNSDGAWSDTTHYSESFDSTVDEEAASIAVSTSGATDVALNAEGASTPGTNNPFILDTIVPTFASVALDLDEYVNLAEATSGVNIDVTTTGAEDGQQVDCTITDAGTGSVSVNGIISGNAATIATGDITSLSDGLLTATCSVSDAAGNPAVDGTDTASKDTVVPTFSFAHFGADGYVNATEAASGVDIDVVTDGAEDGQQVDCTITDSGTGSVGPVSGTISGNAVTIATGALTSLADGTLTSTCNVYDIAGNPAIPEIDIATKDTGVPTISSVALGSDEYVNLADATSGVDIDVTTTGVEDFQSVACLISDTLTYIPVSGLTSGNAVTISSGSLLGLNDGAIGVVCSVSDVAGNTATPRLDTATKDVVASTVTILTPAVSAYVSGTSVFTFSSSEPGTQECNIDGGAWESCASGDAFSMLSDFAGLGEVSFTLNVLDTDAAGNVGTDSRTFTKDTVAPSVTNVQAVVQGSGTDFYPYIDGTVTTRVRADVSDAASGLDTTTCEYTLNNGTNWYAGSYNAGRCRASIPATLTDGDVFTINVRVSDLVGNTGEGSAVVYTVDSEGPHTDSMAISPDPDGTYTSANPTITGTLSDTVSPITSCEYRYRVTGSGSGGWTTWASGTWTPSGDPRTGTCTGSISGLSDGVSYDFSTRAIDTLGHNGGGGENNITRTVDATAPVVSNVQIVRTSPWTNYTPYVRGDDTFRIIADVSDSASGLDTTTCEYTLDGGSDGWPAGSYNSGTGRCIADISPTIADGTVYTVNVRVNDLVGNQGTGTPATYTVDSQSPTTDLITISPDDGTYTNANPTITGTISDSVSPIVACEYRYRVPGNAWPASWSSATWDGSNCIADLSGLLSDGVSYEFAMRGRDSVEHWGGGGVNHIIRVVDGNPPSVDAGTDKVVNALFTQDATASDAGSGIATYSWTQISGPGTVTFVSPNAEDTDMSADTDGTYVVRLTVTDNVGNSAYDEFTLICDTTPPVVTLEIDPSHPDGDNHWYVSKPDVTLSAVDLNLDRIEYQIDSTSGTWITYSSPVEIDDGDYIFYYRALDLAGNISPIGEKDIKVDTNDPDEVEDLQATYNEDTNGVKLEWDVDDSDIKDVYIYRGTTSDFKVNSSSRVAKNDHSDEDFTDYDIERGVKYYYKLVALDDAGNKSEVEKISIEIPKAGGQATVVYEGTEALPADAVVERESIGDNNGITTPSGSDQGGQPLGSESQQKKKSIAETKPASSSQNWWYLWLTLGVAVLVGGVLWMILRRKDE